MASKKINLLKLDVVILLRDLLQNASISLDEISSAINDDIKSLNTAKGKDFIIISDTKQGLELIIAGDKLILNQVNLNSIADEKISSTITKILIGIKNFKSLTKIAFGFNFVYSQETKQDLKESKLVSLKGLSSSFKHLDVESMGLNIIMQDKKQKEKKYNFKIEPLFDVKNQYIFKQNSNFDLPFNEKWTQKRIRELLANEFKFGNSFFKQFFK